MMEKYIKIMHEEKIEG